MFAFLPSFIKGPLAVLGYVINTLFWFPLAVGLGVIKLLLPLKAVRVLCNWVLDRIATLWIAINNANSRLFARTRWVVEGLEGIKRKDWYLVVANHQSWVDILVLQRIFNGRIPFIKFFLKKELLYVPFLGLCWWALDFPFMRRHTKAQIAKDPSLAQKDIDTTRQACEKFRHLPVTVMNFVEGTRFTQSKHDHQQSPFTHLLKPKAGGIGFVLSAMGDKLHKLLDVTICYGKEIPSFWDFISGRVKEIKVSIRVLPIDDKLLGDYVGDAEYKARFQEWVNQLWAQKDAELARLKAK
ncbi:acyltransferase [Gallaecimonas pentaromativorans]|uniref:1-acyl-sn-glycerol-3-phosphate acyltransferase n=1 Tax=Gallaecimonas pentaromativorans TaxID=584787 RepID=A0A3N1NUP4_9GAMM|nr:acyltransferase [Gallaecimonas pentaromativorans]MED5526181.1 acyltransferase [Pseudomonadota bacterium]ROQ19201.1 1-acyl-sn-glycerol-3-phosphate acyltransferase [Gallaecimonas pentaromativorans]